MLKLLLGVLSGIAALLLFVVMVAVAALLVDPQEPYTQDSAFYRFLLYAATALCMWVLHIRVRTVGEEKLPQEH